jgi:hemerythrin
MKAIWNDSLISGNDTIDTQHMELFKYMNNFFDSVNKSRDYEITVRTLNYLVKYVRFHFGSEEEMMKKQSYPDYKEHLAAHRNLVEKLMDCYKTLISKNSANCITDSLTALLQQWFVEHIMVFDMKLAQYLRENEEQHN